MSDSRRRSVRWGDDKRSGSSRSSTVGDQRYNIAALEDSIQKTVNELDSWKKKAIDVEELLRKHQTENKARVTALEHLNAGLEDDKKELEREARSSKKEIESLREEKKELKEKNAKLQKKIEKLEGQSEPSSPDSSKPRRSESKRAKDSEQTTRLKERLNKHSGESPTSASKPPSSSRVAHRGRRLSTSSHHSETPYIEQWGPGPTGTTSTSPSTSSIRRTDNYYTASGYPVSSAAVQSPGYSSAGVPRSAGLTRPTVEYTYLHAPVYLEDGNYHAHPLPPRQ